MPMWFPSKSPGPCCPCDVNFSCSRRDRHARNTAREPALICASSEINPFYPEWDSISIFPFVAMRKIFTTPGNKRKTNCARKGRKKERRRKSNGKRGATWYNEFRKKGGDKEKKRERTRLISRAWITKLWKFRRQDEGRERHRRRKKCGEEAKAIRIFRNYRAGLN